MKSEKIILAVSGSIAAYKAVELASLLKKSGAEIITIMTDSAKHFAGADSFAAVSGGKVYNSVFSTPEHAMLHIDLAKWADKIVIAPASASLISKLASGSAADLLTTVCLATRAPIYVAPAMNTYMWTHKLVQKNCDILRESGYVFLGPASGLQACGDVGEGRMLEAQEIFQSLLPKQKLRGKKILITAGPTEEDLDPVRFISNRSSGKMGYALAQACTDAGADVILISGPTKISTPSCKKFIRVKSALDMLQACEQNMQEVDVVIACAAVCDYRMESINKQKIKKDSETLTLQLVKNPDILSILSSYKPRPLMIGFAVETENVIEHAREKLLRKNLDSIIVNKVGDDFSPFDSEENEISILDREGNVHVFPRSSKRELANKIIDSLNV